MLLLLLLLLLLYCVTLHSFEVPYQTAQKHHIPRQGVYVAQAGFVFGEAITLISMKQMSKYVICYN